MSPAPPPVSKCSLFQSNQEKTYQEFMANKAKERATQLEQYYENIISRTNAELNSILSDIQVLVYCCKCQVLHDSTCILL